MKDQQLDNVVVVYGDYDDPKLPDGEIDVILLVNTWHHIDKRSKYMRKLQDALSPHGRVIVIDFHAGELPVGPAPDHKVSRESVVSEFEKGKWELVSDSVMLPYQYFLTFHPPR